MKKLISLVLVLCMACMLIPALADVDVTGTWYASMMGVPMTMELNADGTGTMTVPGQGETPATWTLEGDQITVTANDSPATGTVTEDSIVLSESGMEFVFTREPVSSITVAEVKAAESEEEFYGEWACVYMAQGDIIMDMSALGGMLMSNIAVKEGGVLEFIPASEEDFMAAMYSLMGLTHAFEDGKLALTSTTEGVDATGTIELLEDGMLKLSLNTDDGPMVFYFNAVEAAE